MARRVSWTNNSSGHLGTYVYRAPTLDPQNLPAPVATVDPVAQGSTAEWVDSEELANGSYDYLVEDFDSSGPGTPSSISTHVVGDDYASAQVGDEIGGGIYAGVITYDDTRQFHIVAAKQSGESSMKTHNGGIAPSDRYDGMANQQTALATGDSRYAIFFYCRDYAGGGFDDWYVPATDELLHVCDALSIPGHPEFSTNLSTYRWSSTYRDTGSVWNRRFSDGAESWWGSGSTLPVRPIRRVAV